MTRITIEFHIDSYDFQPDTIKQCMMDYGVEETFGSAIYNCNITTDNDA